MIIQATRRDPAFFRRRAIVRHLRAWIRANLASAFWAAAAMAVWGGLCLFLLLAGGAQ